MSKTSNSEGTAGDVLQPGAIVAGRYEIQRPLGTGGMGSVYLAHDQVLGGEDIAIKILHRNFAYDKKYTQRFLREVQLMRRVNHKNVVRTYDVGADQDLVYFTMEHVGGYSVVDFLEGLSLTREQLANLIIQTCKGLQAIHEAGIIHRDLKPENLLVLTDGTVKITDFGVARPESSELTAHNEVLGSSSYMAPEVWLGSEISGAVDLYSLGIILYELCTGKLPFEADSPGALMRMHLDEHPVPPKEVDSSIPHWLNKLVLTLLAKNPSARLGSAAKVVEYMELNACQTSAKQQQEESMVLSTDLISQLEAQSKRATDDNATCITNRETRMFKNLSQNTLDAQKWDFVPNLGSTTWRLILREKLVAFLLSRFSLAVLI